MMVNKILIDLRAQVLQLFETKISTVPSIMGHNK